MTKRRLFTCTILAMCFGGTTWAAEPVTADDAVAMVRKAVKFIKANGRDKAFAEFNNPSGQFVDRDLYITVTGLDGVALAHGANRKLIGKNLLDVKDVDGTAFIKRFIEVANTSSSGWVDYKWPDPLTKNLRPKSSYVEKLDDMVVSSGFYK